MFFVSFSVLVFYKLLRENDDIYVELQRSRSCGIKEETQVFESTKQSSSSKGLGVNFVSLFLKTRGAANLSDAYAKGRLMLKSRLNKSQNTRRLSKN
jgi:hypothetical protein